MQIDLLAAENDSIFNKVIDIIQSFNTTRLDAIKKFEMKPEPYIEFHPEIEQEILKITDLKRAKSLFLKKIMTDAINTKKVI